MKLKNIVLSAALTASSLAGCDASPASSLTGCDDSLASFLAGCESPTKVIKKQPTECDQLRQEFKSKVKEFNVRTWDLDTTVCSDNMKILLDLSDTRKTISIKCDTVVNMADYDNIYKGLEYQLFYRGCAAPQPEKK